MNLDSISTGSYVSASVTLNHVNSLVYKTPICANVCAPRSTTVARCKSGIRANVDASVDGSSVSHLDIQTMTAVNASVHRCHASHLLNQICPRASVVAQWIFPVHLDTIWMLPLASVCLGLVVLMVINTHLSPTLPNSFAS